MTETADFGDEAVARELYPIAVRQARDEVALELVALLVCAVLWLFIRTPTSLATLGSLFLGGAVATVQDARWWIWLRSAEPVEAFHRLQARQENGWRRGRLPVVASIVSAAIVIWYFSLAR